MFWQKLGQKSNFFRIWQFGFIRELLNNLERFPSDVLELTESFTLQFSFQFLFLECLLFHLFLSTVFFSFFLVLLPFLILVAFLHCSVLFKHVAKERLVGSTETAQNVPEGMKGCKSKSEVLVFPK